MGSMVSVDQANPSAEVVARVARTLREGGVAVLPTDSVYGICCAATPGNPAHERIFEIKHRERSQTLPWFIADASGLDVYGLDVPRWARHLAERHWPGALTVVVRASDAVPEEYAQVTPTGATIALRVPGSELDRAIVRALGCPLAQTSANTHGAPSATSGHGVEPAIVEAVDLTLDGGAAPVGVASTIVDATGEEPRVLRAGAITEDEVLLLAREP